MAERPPAGGIDHVEVLAAEGAAFLAALRDERWGLPIPAAPAWNRLSLAGHMGKVWHWSARIVAERRQTFPGFDPEPTVEPGTVLGHLESGLVALLDALRTCPDDAVLWTLDGAGDVSFWKRRQAVEVVVHRVDAQAAAGEIGPLDPAVAADGVGELFEMVLPLQARFQGLPPGRLTAVDTDSGRQWTIGSPEGGAGQLSGPASDLLLALWGRRPLAVLAHAGDPAVIAGWTGLGAL